jgi:hypothetical protein
VAPFIALQQHGERTYSLEGNAVWEHADIAVPRDHTQPLDPPSTVGGLY